MEVTFPSASLKIVMIYYPRSLSLHSFLTEITSYVSDLTVSRKDLRILGDFNSHLELPNAAGVKDSLAENNFVQHVTKPTHRTGHMLDYL